ncbi:MAG: hypothetical protein IKN69_04995 [Bacilli bacterium]|nr:hypothetical protein [Bacilli bacterium]
MQTENRIHPTNGRKLKPLLFILSLLMPFLTSAWSFNQVWLTVAETCYIEDFYWAPNDQKDRRMTLHMHMLKDAEIAFVFEVNHTYRENGKNKTESYGETRPGLSYIESRFDFHPYKKGQVIDFEMVVPYSRIRVGDVDQHLLVETRVMVAPETVESWTANVPYGYLYPTTFAGKDRSFENEKAFGGVYKGELIVGYPCYVTVNSNGLEDEYETDSQGLLPLKKMRFNVRNYDDSISPMTMRKGEVRFYNYLDDFHIGTRKKTPLNVPYISVPLELIPDGKESYLRSKKMLFLKSDLRYETNDYHSEADGYEFTTQIFLPPVKGVRGRFYECEIVLEGVGDQNSDTLYHPFTVFRASNDVGSKINSRYYVTEVKADA